MHGPHSHSHALDARREDSRRRMGVALANTVRIYQDDAIGAALTGSLPHLAEPGNLLTDVRAIVLKPERRRSAA
ncbi:MAG: hypothetical protein ACTHLH_06265, partial [Solirubrobacterales bacterium]